MTKRVISDAPHLRKRSFLQSLVKYRTFLLMLAPAVLFTLVFSYFPISGIILAFKKYTFKGGIFGSAWANPWYKNFAFFFKSGNAFLVTKNTVLYNVLFIAVNTVLQIAVAVLITEMKGKYFKKAMQTFMFLPYFISWVVVSVIAFNLLSFDVGAINAGITALGGEKINFYATGSLWPLILSLFGAWKGVGYSS